MTPEFRDFLRRRTMPFLDSVGLDRPISFVLEEVYLQGLRDATKTMEKTDDTERKEPASYCC
jgi:hypothetical protein